METADNIRLFGTTAKGEDVYAVTLRSDTITCEVITFGGVIRTLFVPDRHGAPTDVVLGYDTLEEYEKHDGYLGAVPGRYANRIARCHLPLAGQDYTLTQNDGRNHLHGGAEGFSHRVWTMEACSDTSLTLTLRSHDGDQGYPAALEAAVTYTLQGSTLTATYTAHADGDTVCNLTNHSYFNLAGHSSGTVLGQELMLPAARYTPTDDESLPTGELASVAGTPMDFTRPTAIGARIEEDFIQLRQAKGYDHNFVLDGDTTMHDAARAFCAETGIVMEVATTQPGVQFYSGNYLTPRRGKGGCTYSFRHGFCLETQHFPDSPHHEHFPTTALRAGEEYRQVTSFTFSIQ